MFFIPFIIFALLVPAPSLFVTQIRRHISGTPPPSPLRYVPTFLSREGFSTFFPRPLASNCAYTLTRAINRRFLQSIWYTRKKSHGGARTRDLDLSAFEIVTLGPLGRGAMYYSTVLILIIVCTSVLQQYDTTIINTTINNSSQTWSN